MALILMTCAVYVPAMRGGFVWDDDAHVENNRALTDLDGLRMIWTAFASDRLVHPITTQYYPMTYSTFWVEYHLWGLDTLGYHLVNVLLHGLCAVLLWFVLRRLRVPGAWFAAAVFAVHPVHVESVAWITERKNTLSGAFYLGALLAYLRFRPLEGSDVPGPGRAKNAAGTVWRWYGIAIVLYICALLSKAVTCSLPAAILLLTWWKRDRLRGRDVWPLIPMLAVGALLGLTSVWMERHHAGATGPEWSLSVVERCLLAGRVLWFYAGKLVWPHPLIFTYPRWQIDEAAIWQYLFPLSAAAVISALFLLRGRIGKGPVVAVLFFAGTLTPALGFFNVFPMLFSYVADHFQYLASIGVIVLLASLGAAQLAARAGKRGVLAPITATAVLLILGALTWRQAHAYRDAETLYRDTLAKNPDSWMAHGNLAVVLAVKGRNDDALAHCRQSVRVKPDWALTRATLGGILSSFGRLNEAVVEYREALRIRPEYETALNGLGLALLRQGKTDEAIDHFAQALQRRPDRPDVLNNMGLALYLRGDLDQAVARFTEALRIKPDYADAHGNLGLAMSKQGKPEQAVMHFREALRSQPNHSGALYNLAAVLQAQGEVEEAAANYARLLNLDPDNVAANYGMATVLRDRGQIDQAVAQYDKVLRLSPAHLQAHNNLAWILATYPDENARDGERALALARRACEITRQADPVCLDTLAAAYAEAGRFDEAARVARSAIMLATHAGNHDLAGEIRARLSVYQAGRAFREAPGPEPSGAVTTRDATQRR